MDKQYFFSIVMATHQHGHLIEKAIQSVLSQSFKDWELIIVDDGSTDYTHSIVSTYVDKDERIKYVYQKHKSAASAKNKGMELAKGEYITFLDSDDYYLPSHLEVRHKYCTEKNALFYFGGEYVLGSKVIKDKDNVNNFISVDDCTVGGTFVIHHSLLRNVGFFDDVEYAEDSLYFERVSLNNIDAVFVDHESYIYNRTKHMEQSKIDTFFERVQTELQRLFIGFSVIIIGSSIAYSGIVLLGLMFSSISLLISIIIFCIFVVSYFLGKHIHKELGVDSDRESGSNV